MHLLTPFMDELRRNGCTCELIWLHEKDIQPCRACRFCQRDHTVFGCAIHDDMQEVFDSVLRCGLLVLATPIYSWYCTPPMKGALDRLLYGMNKYYGEQKEPALWAGKALWYGSLRRQLADSLEDKPFPPLSEELQGRSYFAFGSAEDHFKYRDAVMRAYPRGHFPVFEGYRHMEYQIRDPQGFADMLTSIVEDGCMPALPFVRDSKRA